jgi:hypothetical protein
MSRTFILSFMGFVLLAFLCAGCAVLQQKNPVVLLSADSCPPWTPAELKEHVTLFDDRTDTATLQCALNFLRNAKEARIDACAAGAKICFLLADRTEGDKARREGFASEGVRWAERALAQGGEERGDVNYYLAVNLGITVEKHPVAAIKNLDRLVASLEKVMALTPDVSSAGPYRVLGMVYLKAPPWPRGIGDGDKALELLREAVRRSPEYPPNRIFYARALWEMEGEEGEQEITEHLEEALRLLNGEQWKPVRDRWMDDLNAVAKEVQIDLPGR